MPADFAIGFKTRFRKLPTRYAVPVAVGKRKARGSWRCGCFVIHAFRLRARSGGRATHASEVSVFVSPMRFAPFSFSLTAFIDPQLIAADILDSQGKQLRRTQPTKQQNAKYQILASN